MNSYLKVFYFFLCNAIGFSVGPFLYVMYLKYDMLDIESATFNALEAQYDLITLPIFMWLPCVLFSFAIFFLAGYWRVFFLFAPIIAPFVTSVINIQGYL